MKSEEILKAQYIDLVFDGRNKKYGAYDLRQNYPKHVRTALLVTLSIFLCIVGYSIIKRNINFDKEELKDVKVNIVDIPPPPPMDEKTPPPPPPPQAPPPPQRATVQYVEPKVIKDELVKEEVEIAKVEDLKDKDPGTENKEGNPNAKIDVGTEFKDPSVLKEGKKVFIDEKKEEDKIFDVVEQNAEFPGGSAELQKFLSKNIRYPSEAQENNLQGKVYITFTVEKDGSITSAKILKDNVKGGTGTEALRVVNLMPKWKPGKQNGKVVRVKFTLPVNFQLSE